MQPIRLETTSDYRPALMWLMGEINSGATDIVIREFGRRFADLIPSEHHEINNSGNIKWEWAVHWSRQDLYNAGLMGSGGKGIWTITEKGRKWLNRYPDGGGQELQKLIYQTKRAKYGQRKSKPIVPRVDKTRKPTKSGNMGTDRVREIAHTLLDQHISQIKNFLNGRSALRPSDEQFCDWVHFCYAFGLYDEGWEIFRYIDQDNTEAWQYRRTKRYAQVCRTKLRSQLE